MADTATFQLSLKAAEGAPAADPNVTIRLVVATRLNEDVVEPFQGSVNGQVTIPDLPADPWQEQIRPLITLSNYGAGSTDPFFPEPGATISAELTVFRDHDRWRPTFTPLAGLSSPRFDRFHQVVGVSDNIDLKDGPDLSPMLTTFDGMTTGPAQLARMAVLNLYRVLNDCINPITGQCWFDSVQKFVRLDRERFVAEVSPPLFDNMERIRRTFDHFAAIGYFQELDPGAHASNFPSRYGVRKDDVISVKIGYQYGNYQLTLAKSPAMPGVVLLDCDMDEHSELILHGIDCIAHKFNDGTHPIDMHEYILHDASQLADRPVDLDLGYTLAPIH